MILYLGNNIISNKVSQTTMVELGELLKSEGYKVVLRSSKQNKLLRLCSMLWAIISKKRQITHVLIDTYSTQNFYYAFFTSQLCRILNLKYIPILHGGNLPFRLDHSPRISRMIFKKSFLNVAPSMYLKEAFGNKGFQVKYIPNALQLKKYPYLKRGINTPKLLYVRAFASIYNPEMAILVLNELKSTYHDAKLCMIGPEKDSSFEACKDLVNKLGLEESVEFTGKLSKKEWIIKAEEYNVFINTTNIDNTPVSVIEAMALGLPIISTNAGGIPHLIEHKHTGMLVEKGDFKQMSEAIKELVSKDNLVINLSENARRYAEKFDWEIVKKQWELLLDLNK